MAEPDYAMEKRPITNQPRTLGELRRSGWREVSVKDELRRNLIAALREKRPIFQGIVGYDRTVIPQVVAAVLARHDFLLLGLRGQAKTRLIRQLVQLLDEYVPVVEGSALNESPFSPLTKRTRELIAAHGDETPIAWLHRSRRYQEKLATPDVSIADLIGDIDPIKAVARKLDMSDEEVIHFGIIPRSNRGIFAINELPDLQARIQVGLLNIMEEKDVQVRGFPMRLPLDVALVFTANPEDYTNRGNIITPLKDRIDAQILTHYPERLEDALAITAQEAWLDRDSDVQVHPVLRELIEHIAIEARQSDFVDRNSGVSARMAISFLETVHSNAEIRAFKHGEARGAARIGDLFQSMTALTGKMELVHKGEQEGLTNVALHLIGKAVKEHFNHRFDIEVNPNRKGKNRKGNMAQFQPVVDWFESGNVLDLGTEASAIEHEQSLDAIPNLRRLARDLAKAQNPAEEVLFMEYIVEGLHQNFLLTKKITDARIRYTDAVAYMMREAGE
jgi:magnesium chelatase subunit I